MNTRPLFEFISRYKIHLLLFMGLIVGLIYVFLVPPWMHYDEPGHFEYVWLAANQDAWPVEGDYDQYMRREVAASMQEHGFQDYTGVSLPITSVYEPVQLLISQLGDKPLYYFLASLPLRLVKYTDITFQLYICRLVSLTMFLVTVWVSWKVTSLLFGPKHPMSWMVPLGLIAIPGFVDLMTAVNNDVLAIMGFTLFVWASVLLLKRGFSPLSLLFLIVSVLVCYFAKSTAWLALPMSVIVLPLSIVRGRGQKFVWIGLSLILVVAIALGIDWGKTVPAYYVTTGQEQALLRVTDVKAPSGGNVLKQNGGVFYQMLTREGQKLVAGKQVTFSARIWSDKEVDISFPEIRRLDMPKVLLSNQKLHITTQPTQYSAIIDMPEGMYVAWLTFFGSGNTAIYWDDINLTAAQSSEPPEALDPGNLNVVRNSSMESAFPMFRSLVNQILAKADLNIGMTQVVELFDYESVWWYLKTAVNSVFKTFWGSFGWGAVPLLGKSAYNILLVFTCLLGLTSFFFTVKRIKLVPGAVFFLFLIILVVQLILVFARGAGSWYSRRFYPSARYLFPIILPLLTFFVYGVQRLLNRFISKRSLNKTQMTLDGGVGNMLYLLGSLAMMTWGIMSIYSYYI